MVDYSILPICTSHIKSEKCLCLRFLSGSMLERSTTPFYRRLKVSIWYNRLSSQRCYFQNSIHSGNDRNAISGFHETKCSQRELYDQTIIREYLDVVIKLMNAEGHELDMVVNALANPISSSHFQPKLAPTGGNEFKKTRGDLVRTPSRKWRSAAKHTDPTCNKGGARGLYHANIDHVTSKRQSHRFC